MSTNTPTSAPTTSLADVERVVGSWCDVSDPALFTGSDAAAVVERLARVVRRLQAKQAGFAARVEQCHSQPRQYSSSDDYLARVNGSSRGEAKKAIDTARRLKLAAGAAAAAFEQGDLSVSEAHEIAGAVALDPSAEEALVAKATTTHDLADLRERAEKVKACARKGEDPAARRARLRAMRRWQEFERDGMREVMARFVNEDWVQVAPVLQAYVDAVFRQARLEGRRDPIEAYRADALLAALAAAGEAVGLTTSITTKKPTAAGTTGTAATDAESTGTAATDAESAGTAAIDAESTGTAAREAESNGIESAGTAATESPPDPTDLDELLAVRPSRVKWNVTVLVDAVALQRGLCDGE